MELTNKIRKIAPKAIEKMDEVKLQVAEEAAAAIKARAPRLSGDYAESIHAGLQSDNPDKIVFGAGSRKIRLLSACTRISSGGLSSSAPRQAAHKLRELIGVTNPAR
ncbi:hypothetical protein DEA98_16085 [Brucella pseudogrignonensis]|nr:hypothetical protein [Brucella pseudogrignonensis]